ncbi:MAG: hypothetical protein H6601_04270 [Flavobacteriales bacterium]|nr:hypothetical protein [Flavobacteriales bacterium]
MNIFKESIWRLIVLAVAQLAVVILSVAISEEWHPILAYGRLDLAWLLENGPEAIGQYYSHWSYEIFLIGHGLRYGIPIVTVILLLGVPVQPKQNRTGTVRHRFIRKIVVPFGVTLALALVAYLSRNFLTAEPTIFQLRNTQGFLLVNLANLVHFVIEDRDSVRSSLHRFFFEPQLPYSLAITRILFFLYLASYYWGRSEYNGLGVMPREELPMIGWLVRSIPISDGIYHVMCVLGVVFALMVSIGYRTRLFLILNALTVFYVVSVPNFFGKLAHDQLTIWVSWIFAFSPCADVFSVDGFRKNGTGDVVTSKPSYRFHLRVIWMHLGFIYFFAGFYKFWFSGFDWVFSNSMVNQVQLEWFEHFDKLPNLRVDEFPLFLKLGGLAVVLFELAYPFLLINRITRWVSILGGLVMHRIFDLFLYIGFQPLQLVYMVFIPWEPVLEKFGWISKDSKEVSTSVKFNSIMIIGPLFILFANFLCGVGNINSYPFSIYPTYSSLVPDDVHYFQYQILDRDKTDINVWEEGKKHGFFWENYTRTEYHIIRNIQNNDQIDTTGIEILWKRWKYAIPTLQDVDSVAVYIVKRPLLPEKMDQVTNEAYVLTLTE